MIKESMLFLDTYPFFKVCVIAIILIAIFNFSETSGETIGKFIYNLTH